jgi:hypothetical protein
MAVLALMPSGAVATDFGTNGFSENVQGNPTTLEVDPAGGFLLGGGEYSGPSPTVRIAHITGDGQLDDSFAGSGVLSLQGEGTFAFPSVIATSPDGSFALAYTSGISGGKVSPPQYLLGFDADGRATFTAPHPLTNRGGARSLAITDLAYDNRGRLLAIGSWFADRPETDIVEDPAIGRLLPNGRFDKQFGERGISVFPALTLGPKRFVGLAIQDGRTAIVSSTGIRPDRPRGAPSGPVARFELGRGGHNADADRLPDRKDACPRSRGYRRDGCPTFPIRVTVRRGRFTIEGVVRGPDGCMVEEHNGKRRPVRLTVFRQRKKSDQQIGRTRIRPYYKTWSFRVPHRGTYYAVYAGMHDNQTGYCARAVSHALRAYNP